MLAIEKRADVSEQLSCVYRNRLQQGRLPEGHNELRGPVGLFIVRKDGAAGSKLAEEVVGSFGYWNFRSGFAFDGVFLGWAFDGVPVFRHEMFGRCLDDLELALDWTYGGGANLLLTDFVYDVKSGKGHLDFSRTMPLETSELMEAKKLAQLSRLIEELIRPVRAKRHAQPEKSVWDISD